jgi:hypothetical protein
MSRGAEPPDSKRLAGKIKRIRQESKFKKQTALHLSQCNFSQTVDKTPGSRITTFGDDDRNFP